VNSSPRKTVNSSQWIRHQKVKSSQWACHSVFKHYNNFVAFKYFTIWTYLPINIPAVNFFLPSRLHWLQTADFISLFCRTCLVPYCRAI